ncbi:MAG TPA: GNAT family N-acetyltransferase [Candidatus Saccharimonadales bacterium]
MVNWDLIITKHALRLDQVTDNRNSLYLAPFGEAELTAVSPLDTTNIYFPVSSVAAYKHLPPGELTANAAKAENSLTWGIYNGKVLPNNFAGIVSLTQTLHDTSGKPKYTNLMQEIGTYIMRPSARGQGIGTLAKAGLIAHAFENLGMKAVYAYTSEYNHASQDSLSKIGFTCLHADQYLHFEGGEKTETWYLASPRAQELIALQDSEFEALAKGWEQYLELQQRITINRA